MLFVRETFQECARVTDFRSEVSKDHSGSGQGETRSEGQSIPIPARFASTLTRAFQGEVLVTTITGQHVRFSPQGFALALRDARFVALLMVFVLVVMIADASGMTARMPFHVVFALWIVCCFFFVSLQILSVLILALLQRRRGIKRAWLPAIGVVTVTVLTLMGDLLTSILEGRPGQLHFSVAETAFYFFLVQVIETLFVLLAPTIAKEDDAALDRDRWLQVAESSFAIADVLHVTAQEHYVQVALDGRSELLRATFSSVLTQVAPGDGVQIHRSKWIAKDAIRHVHRRKGTLILITRDGSEWPVARPRAEATTVWLEANGFLKPL